MLRWAMLRVTSERRSDNTLRLRRRSTQGRTRRRLTSYDPPLGDVCFRFVWVPSRSSPAEAKDVNLEDMQGSVRGPRTAAPLVM